MSNLSLQQLEETASFYDELMVPAIFLDWPDLILDKAEINVVDPKDL